MERARQWAVRCMHEASLYEENCFITLTYDDQHLPDGNSLDYQEFQLFMKRLRKKAGRKIRFYMSGEYGEERQRPHFHACIFNYNFPDRIFFKTSGKGTYVYTSEILNNLWPKGWSTVCDLTFQSAQYVAAYILKKQGGKRNLKDYEEIDKETGEVFYREKEFAHMSLKPGIGAGWYEKYKPEVFPSDHVIVNGREMLPPRYYTRKLKEQNPEIHEEVQAKREKRSIMQLQDNTEERLLVKEEVLKARIKFKARRSI